jgi:uncharacterized protein YbjQ (UPF0145 family)
MIFSEGILPMPKCKDCGQSFGFMELENGTCKSCKKKLTPPCQSCGKLFKPELLAKGKCPSCNKDEDARSLARRKEQVEIKQLESVILTTESSHNLEILERLGVITAEAIIGTNIFKEILVNVRDVVGGRSGILQKSLKDARELVLEELKREAIARGGNAVVAIDLDYGEISSGGTMLMLVASGTVVKVKI